MNSIYFENDMSKEIIKSVDIITEENKELAMKKLGEKWTIDEKFIQHLNHINKYTFLINKTFLVPDISKKIEMTETGIFSLINSETKEPKCEIEEFKLCKDILLTPEKRIKPVEVTEKFSSLDERINFCCTFKNIKEDFWFLVEIFSTKKIIAIIPVFMEASNKKDDYKCGYFGSINTFHFSDVNGKVTIRIKMFNKMFQKEFNFSNLRNYSNLGNYGNKRYTNINFKINTKC